MSAVVCRLADIPVGEGRNVAVGGVRVAVFHLRDGRVFATEAACPHLGGPLADGLTGSGPDIATVMCPLHDRIYDLRSGAGLNTDCRIRVHRAEVTADGAVAVTLDAGAAAPG